MRRIDSVIAAGHPDFEVLNRVSAAICKRVGGVETLRQEFPKLMRDAIDFVMDSVRTGRSSLSELDNVEKTFIGLKVEHFVRDYLDVPKGIRDLVIDGLDVDIKNTIAETWMIPPETYRKEEPCLLLASEASTGLCWLGLIVARDAYLGRPNRDAKRGVLAPAFKNILWLVDAAKMPASHWQEIDVVEFRELRKIRGGTKRAVEFFKKNLRKRIHRSVVQALMFDQHDYMKRLRANGGARDVLRKERIALLSGAFDQEQLTQLGILDVAPDETVAVKPSNLTEESLLRSMGGID